MFHRAGLFFPWCIYHLLTSASKSCRTQATTHSCGFSASHFSLGGCWLRTKLFGVGQEFLDEILESWRVFLYCVSVDLSKENLNRYRNQFSCCGRPLLHLDWGAVSWEMWCGRQTRRQNNAFAASAALCWDPENFILGPHT